MLIEAGLPRLRMSGADADVLQLNVHPSRDADLRPRTYRLGAAAADAELSRSVRQSGHAPRCSGRARDLLDRFVIADRASRTKRRPIQDDSIADLPDDALLFLVSSRYCDSDKLADFAWSQFGKLSGGNRRGAGDLGFRPQRKSASTMPTPARPAQPAIPCHEGIGVCRDFAHLAIALCRCMNIPACYCTGYLGDIGVPPDVNPGDFSGWVEVFLDGRWWTMDARHNHPRIGRIVMGRGRDAADVAMSTAFGVANLTRFEVMTDEKDEGRWKAASDFSADRTLKSRRGNSTQYQQRLTPEDFLRNRRTTGVLRSMSKDCRSAIAWKESSS